MFHFESLSFTEAVKEHVKGFFSANLGLISIPNVLTMQQNTHLLATPLPVTGGKRYVGVTSSIQEVVVM